MFTLDALTEMLSSPLRFFSYLALRSAAADRIRSGHELVLLSYHLKKNLWLEDKFDFMMLQDDICADLDIAMSVRRDGVEGKRAPEGILTVLEGTPLGTLLTRLTGRKTFA